MISGKSKKWSRDIESQLHTYYFFHSFSVTETNFYFKFLSANNSIQNAGVQYILDSVIPALKSDKSKKFIYVETAFFSRWWEEQHDSVRHSIKKLICDGNFIIRKVTINLFKLKNIKFIWHLWFCPVNIYSFMFVGL